MRDENEERSRNWQKRKRKDIIKKTGRKERQIAIKTR